MLQLLLQHKQHLKIVRHLLNVSKNNKTTINNAEDIDLVILMYSLIKYSSNYSEQ